MAIILCPSIGDWTDDLWLIQKTECVWQRKWMRYSWTQQHGWVSPTKAHALSENAGRPILFLPSSKACKTVLFRTAPIREKTIRKKGKGMTNTKCRWEGEGAREEAPGACFRNASCQLLWLERGYLNLWLLLLISHIEDMFHVNETFWISQTKCSYHPRSGNPEKGMDPNGRSWGCSRSGVSRVFTEMKSQTFKSPRQRPAQDKVHISVCSYSEGEGLAGGDGGGQREEELMWEIFAAQSDCTRQQTGPPWPSDSILLMNTRGAYREPSRDHREEAGGSFRGDGCFSCMCGAHGWRFLTICAGTELKKGGWRASIKDGESGICWRDCPEPALEPCDDSVAR